MLDYVYIACRSHSGSTLLEKLLGTAPATACLGEVAHFAGYADAPDKPCGCGASLADCPFWREVRRGLGLPEVGPLEPAFATDGYRASGRARNAAYLAALTYAPALLRAQAAWPGSIAAQNRLAVHNHLSLVREVVRVGGARLVVDKGMSASRLLELCRFAPGALKVVAVHLTRDGRANAHSHMGRFGVDMETAARGWLRDNRNVMRALSALPAIGRVHLRYEDLCADPEGQLARLARALGLAIRFDPARLDVVQHTIGGNPNKLEGYGRIALDERFRSELGEADRARFERIAGGLNRALGYG